MALSDEPVADVLIIGGGHAGLSAALTLYRALHTTVIFDTKKPRNIYSTPVRLTPAWENQSPEALREASRQELLATGSTTFVDSQVETVQQTPAGIFEIVDGSGKKWLGKKVLLATGAVNRYPDVPGYEELFTRGIYPCMWQFGYEHRGSPSAGLLALGSLASAPHAMMLAHDGHKFADTMTIYTDNNSSLAEQLVGALNTPGITVDDRKIASLRKGDKSNIVIVFQDGSQKGEAFLVHRPLAEVDRRIPDQLGLNCTGMGYVEAPPPFCKTNVAGVYAAGDCATMMHTITNSMAMGSYAACGLSRELPKAVAK